MAKPRLLFISNLFPDLRALYRGLDNATVLHQLSDRWDVAVLAVRPSLPFGRRGWKCRPEDETFFPRYVPSLYLPKIGHKVNHRLMASALRRPLRELRGSFSVALCSWIYPDACAVALLARELGFPFVALAQGSDVHQYLEIPARREIITSLMPGAKAIITRSWELARLLEQAGLAREKLQPIHNGVDLDRFQPGDVLAARTELGLPREARIVLFVGNFYDIKNPVVLVEAFARVCEDDAFANALLVMVGGGPLEGEIQFHAERGACSGRVIIAGRQNTVGVARYMQAADMLCLPSDNEGVPNVILEAFATGLPVVATRVGGISEVHTEGLFGRLVPPREVEPLADAIKATLSELPDRAQIRAHAEKFSWARAAEEYHAVLSRAAQ
jgi:glycosyltransferase involved in cell wall biosynthesis